jgi:hypothetical protein
MEKTAGKFANGSNRRKIIEPLLFSAIILCMIGAVTMPIMMHGDIGFGDSPSYTSMFRFDFANAKEIHRYRLFGPLLARYLQEVGQHFGLTKSIEHLGDMQNFKDAVLRVCFWISNLMSTLITAWALYLMMKPMKPRMLEAIGAAMIYFTSRGYLFNIGTPVVDGWEIAGLSIAAVLLQKRLYISALLTGILTAFSKETSIIFIGLATIAMISRDQECGKFRRVSICAFTALVLAVAPQMIEAIIKGFEEYLMGNVRLSEEGTYSTAAQHLFSFMNNFIESPVATIKAFMTGLIKMNSPVLLIGGLASLLTCMKSGEILQMESTGRYFSLLIFTATGIMAGVFSGVFGMRFLETSFVIIPFLIYGFRKANTHDEDDVCDTNHRSVIN